MYFLMKKPESSPEQNAKFGFVSNIESGAERREATHPPGNGIVGGVHRLALEAVMEQPPAHQALPKFLLLK